MNTDKAYREDREKFAAAEELNENISIKICLLLNIRKNLHRDVKDGRIEVYRKELAYYNRKLNELKQMISDLNDIACTL